MRYIFIDILVAAVIVNQKHIMFAVFSNIFELIYFCLVTCSRLSWVLNSF